MARRWTEKEDLFLVDFFEAVGASIGPWDLDRSRPATKARVKKLKESGAWDAYKTASYHRARALVLAGHIDAAPYSDLACDLLAHTAPEISVVE